MSNYNNLKISVIVPCYNQAQFLPETLNSVLAQTYQNWECIIVNDGSTDNTKEVAENYCAKDKRFIYFQKVNAGLSAARNSGLDIAKGDYIQFIDSDDIINTRKFEIQIASLETEDADVMVCDYNLFVNDVNVRFEDHLSNYPYNLTLDGILYQWNVNFVFTPHSPLVRRSFIIQNNIRFNETVKAREDWIFWCTLAINNARFTHQPQKLAYYRRHTSNMTNNTNLMLTSLFISAFVVEELLPEPKKIEFRAKMADIMLQQLSKTFNESSNAQKARSIDYKLGYLILYPFHRFSGLIKKISRRISRFIGK